MTFLKIRTHLHVTQIPTHRYQFSSPGSISNETQIPLTVTPSIIVVDGPTFVYYLLALDLVFPGAIFGNCLFATLQINNFSILITTSKKFLIRFKVFYRFYFTYTDFNVIISKIRIVFGKVLMPNKKKIKTMSHKIKFKGESLLFTEYTQKDHYTGYKHCEKWFIYTNSYSKYCNLCSL